MLRPESLEQGVTKEINYNITVFQGFAIVEVETDTEKSYFYGTSPAFDKEEDLREHLVETLIGALEWEEPEVEDIEDFYEFSGTKLN